MPFIPHTENDIQSMLEAMKLSSVDALFDEIPVSLMLKQALDVPNGMNEMSITRLMQERAKKDEGYACFIGAGAYDHHIPAAVWELASRGEFLTAYTPYQAEASQGGLQVLYEYQTMIASLTAMDVANASLYDGASALAESVLMAVRCNKKVKNNRVFFLGTLSPLYRKAVDTIIDPQGIELIEIPYSTTTGVVDVSVLAHLQEKDANALIIQQPNFFGCLEAVDELTDWAHHHNMLVVAAVNPTALALVTPPGEWGERGADIACGDGQPLGIPLASGGPSFGFLTCKMPLIRQMPGRVVGRTLDDEGKQGFTLTLQAREQHIRRAKAKSNICTNQGLLVVAAAIYMSLLGTEGLRRVALACHNNTRRLVEKLKTIGSVSLQFTSPFFHEFVLALPVPVKPLIDQAAESGLLIGYDLKPFIADDEHWLLVAVTETKTEEDLDRFVAFFKAHLQGSSASKEQQTSAEAAK